MGAGAAPPTPAFQELGDCCDRLHQRCLTVARNAAPQPPAFKERIAQK